MMYAGDELYGDDVTSGPVIRQEDWDQVADISGLRRVGPAEADVPVEGPVPTAVQNVWNDRSEDADHSPKSLKRLMAERVREHGSEDIPSTAEAIATRLGVPTDEVLDDLFNDEDDDCTWCGGEGYVECDDPIQCTRPHIGGRFDGECECSACHGSGLAKDQTSW